MNNVSTLPNGHHHPKIILGSSGTRTLKCTSCDPFSVLWFPALIVSGMAINKRFCSEPQFLFPLGWGGVGVLKKKKR